jgi:predicted extracellular nuclease
MKQLIVLVLFFLLLSCLQSTNTNMSTIRVAAGIKTDGERGDLRMMFYNVENLFDTLDDKKKLDNEFLPDSKKKWNSYKYWKKVKGIYKVIVSVGGWEPPEIVGLCEIETRGVLEDILYRTPLSKYRYSIVHKESRDMRGIDVALLYRPDKLEKLYERFHVIIFEDGRVKTRDILEAAFKTQEEDTIVVFVNHWPSRRGGQEKSEPKRIKVAERLRARVDSIYRNDNDANIIIMGDLNDHPENISVSKVLAAEREYDTIWDTCLYNLAESFRYKGFKGTHKYQREWSVLDHIIVSGALMDKDGLYTDTSGVQVFMENFLLVEDEKNYGMKPFRTWSGPRFLGGYSDHLPVYMDIRFLH